MYRCRRPREVSMEVWSDTTLENSCALLGSVCFAFTFLTACGLGGAEPTSALDSLQPSLGSLSPAFDPDTEEYTLDAGFFGRSMQFTPTVDDPDSTVEVDGETVVSGEPSQWIPLDLGETTIDVVVTASDDEQTTYTIVVTRAEVITEEDLLEASNAEATDSTTSVAIHGDTLVVGVAFEDSDGSDEMDNSANASGASYVFTRTGTTWTQDAYLKGPSLATEFGSSVAVHGDTIALDLQESEAAYAIR